MRSERVKNLTYMALMAALALVSTFLIRIPVPATQGYVHFGDTILIISVLVLGMKKGAVAGAFGEALADLMGGYAIFAPVTFIAKLLMGILIGAAINELVKNHENKHMRYLIQTAVFCVCAAAVMIGMYYIAESAIYGSFVVPLVEVPANLIQFVVSAVLGGAIGGILCKTSARKYFRVKR